MSDLFSPRAHFRAFGFAVLPGALRPEEAAALAAEADHAVRDATGDRYLIDAGLGGITGHYIPATGDRTPRSRALIGHFAPLVEDLLGVSVLPALTQHTLFFDAAGWHTDTGHSVPSAKAVVYLQPLDVGTGALRVLPGSHALDERVLTDLMRGPAFRDEHTWRDATAQVPAYVITSRPGDVIVFDEHLWHASIGGRNRLQWSATYVLDPATPEEGRAVSAYLDSQFSADRQLDYDPAHYPYYSDRFRAESPARWITQLEQLGAFAAAAAEQRQPAPDPAE